MARTIEIVAELYGLLLVPNELAVVMRAIERETIPARLLTAAALFQAAYDLERRRRPV